MANKSYSEKLKDPRWQKKRLDILNRDEFKCRSCSRDNHPLNVHHLFYSKKLPWDEPNENLITLCDDCHAAWHHIYGKSLDPSIITLVVELFDRIVAEQIDEMTKKYYEKHPNAKAEF